MDDVDLIGGDMHHRRRDWDCTGLGPEGCLGPMMTILMCQIDGPDWVQQYACAPPADAPGGPADVDPDAEPLLIVQNPDRDRWVRAALERTRAVVVGGQGRTVYVGELGRIQNYERRGAAPPPFDHLLAQGGR